MSQDEPTTISTPRLQLLLAGAAPPWLVYAPDRPVFAAGHIPGSLSATDAQVLGALPHDADVVVYGEDRDAERAKALAVALQATRRWVRWYDGGVAAWVAAGLGVERAPERGGGR